MIHQQIRPSQFITTYGPGSILETRSGPVVVLSADRIFNDNCLPLQNFEIQDARIIRDLAIDGAGIVRIPSNAEISCGEQDPIYATDPLPYWSLCVEHSILYWARDGCPQCPKSKKILEKAGHEAIRFVRACESGHVDDVDWDHIVHNSPACQGQPKYYLWERGGSSLSNVEIQCPNPSCGARVNFGAAYSRSWRCSGRYPERSPRRSSCNTPARIVQRGSANLRIPEILTALTIPPLVSQLHVTLQDSRLMALCSTLLGIDRLNEDQFRQGLADLQPAVSKASQQFIQTHSWGDIQTAIKDVMAQSTGAIRSLREEEFESLRSAATNGAPPVPASQVGAPPLFEVKLTDVQHFQGPHKRFTFRVVPVSRLRVVMVQTGYRRLNVSGQLVSVAFEHHRRSWFPGVELFGEGIFIEIEGEGTELSGDRAQAWDLSWTRANPADPLLHPLFVWWHTLSHRLLRALSVDSGYSSASIRERVYLQTQDGQRPRGGILLYTVQPGGDGTLGGLIGLAPSFGNVIASALKDLSVCSNDPLCGETLPNGTNGSACYACLLASETSCEQWNTSLDRKLLLQNLP